MGISLRRKIFLGYAMPFALLLAVAITQTQSLQSSLSTTQWVIHTEEAIVRAEGLAKTIADARAAERDFLFAGEPSLLLPYDATVDAVLRTTAELRIFVSDNSEQVLRLDQISVAFERWRREQADPSIRVRVGAARSTKDAVAIDSSSLEEARATIDAFISEERRLLDERVVANRSAIEWDRTTSIAFPIAGVVLTLITGLWLSARIGRAVADLASTAAQLSSGNLERRARVQSTDELGSLAVAFNAMADRLIEGSRESALLKDFGEELQSCLRVDEAYDALRRFAPRALPATTGGVYIINASRNLVLRVVNWGNEQVADTFTAEQCWALRRGRPYLLATNGAPCAHVFAGASASYCVPLVAHGESVGVLHVLGDPAALSERRCKFVETLAEQVALALANLQLREKLEWQSVRDPLTGLYNRRFLEETLAREIIRAERAGHGIGLMVIDVDHFKRFNDTFGHEAGDLVLREVGALAVRNVRGSDVACRFGGEEFVVLLPGANEELVAARAEKLRAAVRALSLTYRGAVLGRTTISIGVSVYPLHAATGEALLRAADGALYGAKSQGRDRVCVAGSPSNTPNIRSPEQVDDMAAGAGGARSR